MVSSRVFSDLLTLLHSTPLEPENWERFLREVCTLTEARHGFLICSSSNLGLHVLGQGGSYDMLAAQRAYNESSGSMDPFRLPMLTNPRVGVVEGDDLVPEGEFLKTPLYLRYLKPMGLRYLTAMALSVTARRMEAVSFWRGIDQGPMEAGKRELLEMLMPHVGIALEVRHKLMAHERRADNLQAMLDRTDAAAFLLSGAGRVLHGNRPAGALLEAGKTFEVRKGKLRACDRQCDRELQALIAPAGAATGGAVLIHREPGLRRPLQVIVSPVHGDEAGPQAAAAMVLVTDPEREISFPDAVLKGLYGLTPAETEVANGYLTGYTSDEIALLRGVSLSTVRSQLKVLLQKTATRRQSDLMRLLMMLPRVAESGSVTRPRKDEHRGYEGNAEVHGAAL